MMWQHWARARVDTAGSSWLGIASAPRVFQLRSRNQGFLLLNNYCSIMMPLDTARLVSGPRKSILSAPRRIYFGRRCRCSRPRPETIVAIRVNPRGFCKNFDEFRAPITSGTCVMDRI